jgi:hypothetical protein
MMTLHLQDCKEKKEQKYILNDEKNISKIDLITSYLGPKM